MENSQLLRDYSRQCVKDKNWNVVPATAKEIKAW